MATILEEINKLVERLPLDRQQRVLEFAQKLTQADQASIPLSLPTTPLPPGTPGLPYYKCASCHREKMLKQWSVHWKIVRKSNQRFDAPRQ